MKKRALLIAFHFPPQAASSGIQRTLSFSKNLGNHDWDPIVLSAHPRAYSTQNPTQLASIPPGMVVRRAFSLDTKHHLGIKGRYLEALALPDRWVSWAFGAIPAGLRLIRQHRPQVIWSTFPIATAHLIGLALHRATGLPWIADFRDPMLQISYPTSSGQRRIYGWIEHQTITRCHTAVFTTHSAMQSYRERFPHLPASKFKVIENGYDEDGFGADATAAPQAAPGADMRRMTLVHSGVLYQSGRDPGAFMEAIARLKAQGEVDAARLRVILRAPGAMEDIQARAVKHGVEDIVEVAPAVPYKLALQEMLAADGLLVFQGTPFNTQVPAKIYEYFRARKPILALVDPVGETAHVLRTAGFADIADMDSAASIAPVLRDFISQVGSGSAKIASEDLIKSSSRQQRASELASLFDAAVN
ncbi:MAG: glycosyltransferase [Massilia sp.]|nr:glycosyltransferase [Massilia sp.]